MCAKLCIDASAANAAAITHHQLADSRLRHAFDSWSHTSTTSTASTATATPMMTQRSHQYLPRVRASWRLTSVTTGRSRGDTPYRVTVQARRKNQPPGGAPRPLQYRHAMGFIG